MSATGFYCIRSCVEKQIPNMRAGLFLVCMAYREHVGVAWWEESSKSWQGKVTTTPKTCLLCFAGYSLEEAKRRFHELVDEFIEEAA